MNLHDLELIRQSPGSPGNDVAARCSEPPFPTRGGQDDSSYNKLPQIIVLYFVRPFVVLNSFFLSFSGPLRVVCTDVQSVRSHGDPFRASSICDEEMLLV